MEHTMAEHSQQIRNQYKSFLQSSSSQNLQQQTPNFQNFNQQVPNLQLFGIQSFGFQPTNNQLSFNQNPNLQVPNRQLLSNHNPNVQHPFLEPINLQTLYYLAYKLLPKNNPILRNQQDPTLLIDTVPHSKPIVYNLMAAKDLMDPNKSFN